MKNADAAAMWDRVEYNAGFVVIKPTANGLKLWEITSRLTSVGRRFNDQQALNVAVRQLKGKGNTYQNDYSDRENVNSRIARNR